LSRYLDGPTSKTLCWRIRPTSNRFTDKTASLVSGQVLFQYNLVKGSTCPVAGAVLSILKNGSPLEVISDSEGRFSFSANTGEIVEVTVSYGEHTFADNKISFQMGTGNRTIAFYDTTKELLDLALKAESNNTFEDKTLHWNVAAGICEPALVYSLKGLVKDHKLPALEYTVSIKSVSAFRMFSVCRVALMCSCELLFCFACRHPL
jgi:hypothetical protein